MKWLLCWFAAVSLVTFCAFGWDKRRAVRHKRRVRESTLLGLSAAGGAAGGLLAMYLFRHKTLKKPFSVGVPLMLAAHTVLAVWLFRAVP